MLTLELRQPLPLPLDAAAVRPDLWRGLSAAAVARVKLRCGRTPVEIGEVFRVAGDSGGEETRLDGDLTMLQRLAAGMTVGSLIVEGSVGPHAFVGMTGGRGVVRGDAAAGFGLAMHGGELHLAGDAGDDLGGAEPGCKAGMRGGTITVLGNVGDSAGAGLRRGWIAVAGRCGAYAGAAMRAGTFAAFGGHGPHAGVGMVRGTLLLAGAGPDPGANFAAACDYPPPWLAPLFAEFRRAGLEAARPELARRPWRRWSGDLLELSRGEILRPVSRDGV